MKKTLSLLLVLALTLSCMFTLIACGGCDEHVDANYDEICDVCEEEVPYTPAYLGFEGIYNTSYEEEAKTVYTGAAALTALKNTTYSSSTGILAIYTNSSAEAGEIRLAVLNTETGAVVLTLTKEAADAKVTSSVSLQASNEEVFIRKTSVDTTNKHKTVRTYSLYTALGAEITSKTNSNYNAIGVLYLEDDLYLIDEKVYEVKDGVATFKYDATFAEKPDYDHETEKYNYIFKAGEAYVYDKTHKIVATWTVPVNASEGDMFLLSNGNILIQYFTSLPWDAAEYDVYEGAMYKYNVTSLIFDVESKTEKALELDYIVYDVQNALNNEKFNDYFVKGKLHNVVEYNKIVDKMVKEDDDIIADMTDDMFTVGYLGEEIAGQDGLANLIADNRFVVYNKAGQEFLLNEKGEVIGEITGAQYKEEFGLFVDASRSDKAYDLDLKVSFDMAAIEYEFEDGSNTYAIFSDTVYDAEDNATTTYYLFDYAQMKKLTLPEDVYGFDCYGTYFTYEYEVTEENVTKEYRTYCNVKGDVIKTVVLDLNSSYYVVESGDIFMLRVITIDAEFNTTTEYFVAK